MNITKLLPTLFMITLLTSSTAHADLLPPSAWACKSLMEGDTCSFPSWDTNKPEETTGTCREGRCVVNDGCEQRATGLALLTLLGLTLLSLASRRRVLDA